MKRSATAKTVARNLRIWRAANNVNQKELARRNKVKQSRIAQIEAGTCELRTSTLDALAEATGMTVADLVTTREMPGHVIDNTNR